jgi:hypothetical protein
VFSGRLLGVSVVNRPPKVFEQDPFEVAGGGLSEKGVGDGDAP